MRFSQDDTDRIRTAMTSALSSSSLTAWQRTFISDMQDRFRNYGTRTRLSEKQYATLKQILAPFENSATNHQQSASGARPRPTPAKPKPNIRYQVRFFLPSPFRAIRRAHRTVRDMGWVLLLVLGVSLALGGLVDAIKPTSPERLVSPATNSHPSVYSAVDFTVTDGDTVHLNGASKGTRLVGFNTPETKEPRCSQELALGRQATSRLRELIAGVDLVQLRLVACSCPAGTEGTEECNFGRSCGVLTVDGRDVGDILIAEGLAVRFLCGPTSCPSTPRPWCD